jgi:hypothetical protein
MARCSLPKSRLRCPSRHPWHCSVRALSASRLSDYGDGVSAEPVTALPFQVCKAGLRYVLVVERGHQPHTWRYRVRVSSVALSIRYCASAPRDNSAGVEILTIHREAAAATGAVSAAGKGCHSSDRITPERQPRLRNLPNTPRLSIFARRRRHRTTARPCRVFRQVYAALPR